MAKTYMRTGNLTVTLDHGEISSEPASDVDTFCFLR
jgi:hypothetical protein